MAKMKMGSIVTDIRGSIAGVTFARNRGGAYSRGRTSPVQPNSVRQAAMKGIFAAAINSWTNLLDAGQRAMWDAYAASVPYTDIFGETRYYSGQNRYAQAYIAGVNAGRSVASIAGAPTTYTAAEGVVISRITVEQGATEASTLANVVNSLAPSDAEAGDILLISFGKPITSATNYFKGPYRHAGISTFVSGTAYPEAGLTDPYGRTISEGMVLPIMCRILKADNRISPSSRTIVTVAAYSA
jgi:hypothetical protein